MIQDMKTGGSILLNGDDDLLRDMGPVKGVDPEFFRSWKELPVLCN